MTRIEAVKEAARREAQEGQPYMVCYNWIRGNADPPSEGYYIKPGQIKEVRV
jgi:hypothetical protein